MASKDVEYTRVLQLLGGISGKDFESWKSLCMKSGNIKKAAMEKIDNPLDLIELLEQRNLVNENNVSMLVDIMQQLNRLELSNKLLDYEKKWALRTADQMADYNSMLLKIGGALSGEEVNNIKFLCRTYAGFTKDNRDKMHSFRDVAQYLEQALLLDKTETSTLKDLMVQIERLDLAKHVENYEKKYLIAKSEGKISGPKNDLVGKISGPQNDLVDLSGEFDVVVKYIGRNWRQLARQLRVTEADIDFIVVKHPHNLREQSRESLKIWQENNGISANREALVNALRRCEFNYVADVMERKIIE